MSTLFNTLYAWKCKGSHHKLAMQALMQIDSPHQERWIKLFLMHIESYLTGSKDPDKKFKDFRNHVIHVEQNHWGGAVKAAQRWYDQTVTALKDEQWSAAIYAAGVLSHYVVDPIQPLHTDQSKREGEIHRACEWSISKSFDSLVNRLLEQQGGWKTVELPNSDDWLTQLIHAGAEQSHKDYQTLVVNYDLHAGSKKPEEGLDNNLQTMVAKHIGLAVGTYAAVLNKAIDEANVIPPFQMITLRTVLTQMTIPLFWVTQKMEDASERRAVEAIYQEIQETGGLVENLPEETQVVRAEMDREGLLTESLKQKFPAAPPVASDPEPEPEKPAPKPVKPVIKVKSQITPAPVAPAPVAPTPEPIPPVQVSQPVEEEVADPFADQAEEVDETRQTIEMEPQEGEIRFYLNMNDPIVDAPSIGPKTARRLRAARINRVCDLLDADPEELAEEINQRWINADLIQQWQTQSSLMCQVPNLRGHDVQFLVACGVEDPDTLALSDPEELLKQVSAYIQTKEGQYILRSGKAPDNNEIEGWIMSAHQSRSLAAA